MKLSYEQLLQAARVHDETYSADERLGMDAKIDAMAAAAPYLQAPWEPARREELDAYDRDYDRTAGNVWQSRQNALNLFVSRRNAKLLPKPVDPRREKIEKVISDHCGHALGLLSPGLGEKILAALDTK